MRQPPVSGGGASNVFFGKCVFIAASKLHIFCVAHFLCFRKKGELKWN